jgi:hypothetical protein
MGLTDIVQLTITRDNKAPTKAGFTRPLIAGYHTKFAPRTKLYKDPSEMIADGFTVNDMLYKKAVIAKSQNPAPKDFKIGRCALPPTQIVDLTPTVTTPGFVHSGRIKGVPAAPDQTWTYTNGGAETLASVCTAVAAAITALAGVTATGASGTKVVSTTDTAGLTLEYLDMPPELKVQDQTADPGIATDLNVIFDQDSDWFGLLLASNSEAEVNAAAAWVESKRKLFVFQTADFGAKDPGTTTDVFSDLKTLAYVNTGGFWHQNIGSGLDAAIMAKSLVEPPGSITWAHKSVTGVPVTTKFGPTQSPYLTTAQEAAVQAKNGNTYTEIAGNGNTFPGKVAGGDYLDIIHYVHFLYARMQERVIGALQSQGKIPYTRKGIEYLRLQMLNLLLSHSKKPYEALSTDPLPVVTAPDLADIDASDKAARHVPDFEFEGTVTGAVHSVEIRGRLVNP